MPRRKPAPEYKITGRSVKLRGSDPLERTSWPWPFEPGDHDSPVWKVNYAPERLTREDLGHLAAIASAYKEMITHPSSSVADAIHDLRRVYRAETDKKR